MVNKETLTSITVYTGAIADQVTNHGVAAAITSSQISGYVICGITVGGWVTIIVAIGALLIFIMNVVKFIRFGIDTWKKVKSITSKWKKNRVDIQTSKKDDSTGT